MNREDIIKLAEQAGDDWETTLREDQEFLIRFASLVASSEREACANVCEQEGLLWGQRYAKAIRARGKE